MKKKQGFGLLAKQKAAGWGFLAPASLLIFIMSFYPMVKAFITSLQTGPAAKLAWAEPIFKNYTRMVNDKVFLTAMGNTFLYLLIQVPIMLILAMRDSAGFLLPDLQNAVCQRGPDQQLPQGPGDHPGERQLARPVRYGQGGHHHRPALALDRLQYGLLPGRPAEHRVFGV